MILWWGLAAILIMGGCFSLGIYVGLGTAEDRRQRAECDQLAGRAPAPAPIAAPALEAPSLEAPAGWRVPGYADPFPRPGRLMLEAAPFTAAPAAVTVVDMAPVQDAPHGGEPRPSPSPDDLDPAVRALCEETQAYVAALIARTRHTERKYT